MMSCDECKLRMYPEDPSVPTGPYHHSTCDYFCSKPTYYRELEQQEPREVIHRYFHSDLSQKQNDGINQLVLRVDYLDKKVNTIFEKKKGKKVYHNYATEDK